MNFRERLQHEARAFAALLRPQNLAPLLLGAAMAEGTAIFGFITALIIVFVG